MKKLFKNVDVQGVRDVKKRQRERLGLRENIKSLVSAGSLYFASIFSAHFSYLSLSSLACSGIHTIFGSGHMCTIVA